MSDLPPGSYDLQFDASDTAYLSQWWSGAATRDQAGILVATAGGTQSGLNASLTRGATVSGRVDGSPNPLTAAGRTTALGATALEAGATIGGHVYAGSTTQPMAGAQVVAVTADSDPSSDTASSPTTVTDDTGAYSLAGLPADVYTIHVIPPAGSDYAEQWWQGAQKRSHAAYVVLPDGSSRTGMDAVLVRTGSISGRATTESGAPIADVVVQAAPVGTETWSSVTTDVDGNYTLGGLAPDAYVLSFDGQAVGYQTTWWSSASPSGVATRAAATPVTLAAGGALSGYSVQMAIGGVDLRDGHRHRAAPPCPTPRSSCRPPTTASATGRMPSPTRRAATTPSACPPGATSCA